MFKEPFINPGILQDCRALSGQLRRLSAEVVQQASAHIEIYKALSNNTSGMLHNILLETSVEAVSMVYTHGDHGDT